MPALLKAAVAFFERLPETTQAVAAHWAIAAVVLVALVLLTKSVALLWWVLGAACRVAWWLGGILMPLAVPAALVLGLGWHNRKDEDRCAQRARLARARAAAAQQAQASQSADAQCRPASRPVWISVRPRGHVTSSQ